MRIWIGYHCTYNFCDTWKNVEKVFDDEVKALLWTEDREFLASAYKWTDGTEMEWREYKEHVVE